MSQIFDVEAWRQVLLDSLLALGNALAAFVPKLVGTLLIVAAGWLVSWLTAALAERLLRQLGLDRASSRLGLSASLAKAGLETTPSRIGGRIVFWLLMLTFVVAAVETLGLTAVTGIIDRLIGFLPNLFAAGLILVLGLLLARLTRTVVSSGALVADVTSAARAGALAETGVVLVVGVVALEQLGVETSVVVTVVTALVASLGLTVGASFALGARPVITHILAGHFLRQSLPIGGTVEVDGRRGVVERVGAIDTLLRDGEQAFSIPNARLMEEIVDRG